MDLRKCTRCGFAGELSQFAAIGEGHRHELCKNCWVAVREDRFNGIEVEVDGNDLQYVSLELAPVDFESMLTYLQSLMGLTDVTIAGIRAAGVVPYMQCRSTTQLIYKR